MIFRMLALAAVFLGSSGGTVRAEPWRVFLADLASGEAPAVEVGGEQRPVLFHAGMRVIAQVSTPIPVPPGLELRVPVTAADVPGGASVKAIVVVGDQPRAAEPVVEAAGAMGGGVVTLRLGPEAAGGSLRYLVWAELPPPRGQRTDVVGPVRAPVDARLTFAIGFEPERCAEHPPVDVRVDVLAGGGNRSVFRRRLEARCGRWLPFEVPLQHLGGAQVRLRFRARMARPGDRAAPVSVLWGDPILEGRPPVPPPPNVIVISLDTLAAGHLGVWGHHARTSPFLDRLAAESVRFENAIAHYPSTAASHMSLFTGLLPARHGVRGILDRLATEIPTLPALLRRAGYATAAVTEDAFLSRKMGFARGFQVYRENRKPLVGLGGIEGSARTTLRRGLAWLRRRPAGPYFLFLHTYQVHAPYTPPPGYLPLVRPGIADDGASARYDAEIRYLDRLLARFFAALRARGELERTVVIVLSDHGEAFGEHGAWEHGGTLWDEVMRVPLLVRLPEGPRGLRVAARVGLVDVLPTALELAGVPTPPGLAGRSLAPALRGQTLAARPLVAEVRGTVVPAPEPDLRAVWIGSRKVIEDVAKGRWQVFDLERDPGERHDLAAEAADVLEEARSLLADYSRLAPGGLDEGAATVDQETLEKLRALGYVR